MQVIITARCPPFPTGTLHVSFQTPPSPPPRPPRSTARSRPRTHRRPLRPTAPSRAPRRCSSTEARSPRRSPSKPPFTPQRRPSMTRVPTTAPLWRWRRRRRRRRPAMGGVAPSWAPSPRLCSSRSPYRSPYRWATVGRRGECAAGARSRRHGLAPRRLRWRKSELRRWSGRKAPGSARCASRSSLTRALSRQVGCAARRRPRRRPWVRRAVASGR